MGELGARGISCDLVLGSGVLTFRRRRMSADVRTIPLRGITSLRLLRANLFFRGELCVNLVNHEYISVCFTRTHAGDFDRIHEAIRNTLAATPARSSSPVRSAWRAS